MVPKPCRCRTAENVRGLRLQTDVVTAGKMQWVAGRKGVWHTAPSPFARKWLTYLETIGEWFLKPDPSVRRRPKEIPPLMLSPVAGLRGDKSHGESSGGDGRHGGLRSLRPDAVINCN